MSIFKRNDSSQQSDSHTGAQKKVFQMEQRLLLISFSSSVLFVLVEVIFSLFSHSQSTLMDAVNDAAELVVTVLTLFLNPLFHQPISEKRPFGYAQVESIFTAAKAIMMISVMLTLSVNVIQTALAGGANVNYGSVSLFQLILGLVSLVILLVIYSWNRKVSSPTVRAEVLGWKIDATYSLGLAAAFFLAKILEKTPLSGLSPYFDQIVALFVVVFSLPEAVRLLRESVRDIFLFAPEEETTDQIKSLCAPVLETFAFQPVFYDITRTGRRTWVTIYIQIAGDTLSVKSLQQASQEIDRQLSAELGCCICELLPTLSNPDESDPFALED